MGIRDTMPLLARHEGVWDATRCRTWHWIRKGASRHAPRSRSTW